MLQSLWIMRHGLAESQFDSDFNRALSEVGKGQALNIADQLLIEEKVLPSEMLVSPFRRTRETADIVHQRLALKSAYETEELLVHFADPKLLGDFLIASNTKNLIVVSHMPIVAELCLYLQPDCNIFGFQTAQVVKFEFAENATPKVSKIYLPNSQS